VKIDIERLFESRPEGEIIEISSKEREKILREVESLVFNLPSKSALNGGSLTTINSAMIKSLLELFVRNEALTKSKISIIEINIKTYQNALRDLKEYIEKTFDHFELLRSYWFSKIKSCVTEIFTKSEKIFETYIIGELCEKFYLDNKSAAEVIEELKREDFIKVVDTRYNQNLVMKI